MPCDNIMTGHHATPQPTQPRPRKKTTETTLHSVTVTFNCFCTCIYTYIYTIYIYIYAYNDYVAIYSIHIVRGTWVGSVYIYIYTVSNAWRGMNESCLAAVRCSGSDFLEGISSRQGGSREDLWNAFTILKTCQVSFCWYNPLWFIFIVMFFWTVDFYKPFWIDIFVNLLY